MMKFLLLTVNCSQFQKYLKIIRDNELEPSQIYNADETNLSWKEMPKIRKLVSKKQVLRVIKLNKSLFSAELCNG